ncbi:Kruppel [Carabus blaptoides fortunei]
MPLLQESQSKRELLTASRDTIKQDPDEITTLSNPLNRVTFPTLPNTAMFTPSQLLVASQTAALMAASGLGLQANPAFFHPGLFASAWTTQSPPSPTPATEQLSPALKARKHNNNNNVVSSSSTELKAPKRKLPRKAEDHLEVPLSPPTSGSSPPSSTEVGTVGKDVSRDKQFTCGVCNRSFGRHLRVHTGERPYACQYCTARFSDSNQLKAHVLIHKGEKPFECDRCNGRFRRRHHLLHHKCGSKEPERPIESAVASPPASDVSDDVYLDEQERKPVYIEEVEQRKPREMRRVIRTTEPLISLPLRVALPEQTEPEDLSMSTGLHSHSSGDSPLSRSPSSPGDVDEEYELDDAASLFLKRRPPMPS